MVILFPLMLTISVPLKASLRCWEVARNESVSTPMATAKPLGKLPEMLFRKGSPVFKGLPLEDAMQMTPLFLQL